MHFELSLFLRYVFGMTWVREKSDASSARAAAAVDLGVDTPHLT